MEKRIVCVGELLIDFICMDVNTNLIEGSHFIKKAGGAPANVAGAIAKLGGEAQFVGKVGKDSFGVFLKNTLVDLGVDPSMLVMDESSNTTLAFVSLQSNGERDFIFNRGADELLRFDEIDPDVIATGKILHLGSATALLGGDLGEAYDRVLALGRKEGLFISFDPNYRSDLWKGREREFIQRSEEYLRYADFTKVSEEELRLITGEKDLHKGINKIHSLGSKILAVTLGKEGTLISNGINSEKVETIAVESIDSTGAGDAFVGAVLYQVANIENLKGLIKDFAKIKEIVYFANKVGALVCTKMGAMTALPSMDEVEGLK